MFLALSDATSHVFSSLLKGGLSKLKFRTLTKLMTKKFTPLYSTLVLLYLKILGGLQSF